MLIFCKSRHGVFVRHDKLILDKKRRGSRKRAKDSVKRHSMGQLSGSNPNLSSSRSPGTSSMTSPTGSSSFMKPTSSSSAKKNR
ncbi:hypothetical protein KUTeg_000236 [Tegillarca granosa]|uniref:Uncharacterized protein n=1 Tax=Tegillarca granosa TaxID=220873 RepID=A0ABQ9G1D1_TEGGR|nr:hypothetical protein KUTeg_000236 [Tegillarca granosa]